MSSDVEAGVCKLNSIHRSCRKSDRKREGQLLFLIIAVSYNARYAKLRGAKNAHFPDFVRFSLGWLIFRLNSAVLLILHFLPHFHILLFYLSLAYRLFQRSALHHWFVLIQLFLRHLYGCFTTLHVAFYNLQFAYVFVCFCADIALCVSNRSHLWILLHGLLIL